jgi:hypothetical protein
VEIKNTIKKIQIPNKKLKKIIEITRFACQNIKYQTKITIPNIPSIQSDQLVVMFISFHNQKAS